MFWNDDPPELQRLKEKKAEYTEKRKNGETLKEKLVKHQENISFCLLDYKDILPTGVMTTTAQGSMMDTYNSAVAKFNEKCSTMLEDLDKGIKLLEGTITAVEASITSATTLEDAYQRLIDDFNSEE